MPSKRNKRNNRNKQKLVTDEVVESEPTVVFTEPSQDLNDCVRRGFTVIPNNGIVSEKREHYTSSCFFKSISDYLHLTTNKMSAINIRRTIKFPKQSVEVDTVTHAEYIQAVCNTFKVSIAFFTVNTDLSNNYACWIGNPGIIFRSTVQPSSHIAIASYGAHYELIVSETPFSPDLRNRCKHFKVKTHDFQYDCAKLVYTCSEETQVCSYKDVVKKGNTFTLGRVDLERQLIDAQLNYTQQESITEILKKEIIKLTRDDISSNAECRLRYLQEMIDLSMQCCNDITDNIVALQFQLQSI